MQRENSAADDQSAKHFFGDERNGARYGGGELTSPIDGREGEGERVQSPLSVTGRWTEDVVLPIISMIDLASLARDLATRRPSWRPRPTMPFVLISPSTARRMRLSVFISFNPQPRAEAGRQGGVLTEERHLEPPDSPARRHQGGEVNDLAVLAMQQFIRPRPAAEVVHEQAVQRPLHGGPVVLQAGDGVEVAARRCRPHGREG